MKNRIALLMSVFILYLVPSKGQDANMDTLSVSAQNFYDLSLEDLMGLEVSVASMQALTPRESPGVITLITEDEIKSSGARDLMDLLRMVPGFDFGVDVEGVVGLGVRGNWAHEGKALLLIDGLEMNENLFSTLQFGNHYPINDIRKIEIIRGPGSAIYGGNAEYAVINIITKSPAELNGADIKCSYGYMMDTEGHRSVSLATGKQFGRFGYSVNYFGGKSIRSDREYHDFFDGSFDMSSNSKLQNHYFNVGLNYNKLQLRILVDKYSVQSKDNYDAITSRAYTTQFDSYIAEIKEEVQVLKNLTITPKINFKLQLPWNFDGEVVNEEVYPFNISTIRYTGGVTSSYDPNVNVNIVLGFEHFYDQAKQLGDDVFVSNQSKNFNYNNTAVFSQAIWKTKIVNITAGARYNSNERFASSFVPRLSLTRAFDKVHFKLLYSQAYRAPNTQNMDLNSSILPEKTTVIEFETGVKLGNLAYLTGNVFDITTKDPIIFYYDNKTDGDMYANSDQTGTKGIEMDVQWKYKKGYLDLRYGYYSAKNKNKLDNLMVPDEPDALLGFANQKLTLGALWEFYKNYSINPSAIWSGVKYGTVSINENGESVIGQYDPVFLLNLSFRAENFMIRGLEVSLGVFNLLNENEEILQPYNGGHAPLPGASREVNIKLAYKFQY